MPKEFKKNCNGVTALLKPFAFRADPERIARRDEVRLVQAPTFLQADDLVNDQFAGWVGHARIRALPQPSG